MLAELQEKAQELKNVCEAKGKLEGKLKGVNTEKKELEDKLKEAAHIMKEKEQYISNLKLQVQELKDEYKAQLESYEQGICKLAWEVEELRSKLECENEWDDKVVEIADGLGEKFMLMNKEASIINFILQQEIFLMRLIMSLVFHWKKR